MKETTSLNMLELQDDITIAAARRSGNDVLVEWPRYEDYQHEDIHHGADGAHGLGAASREQVVELKLGGRVHLHLLELAHVASLEATGCKSRSQPADECVACCKGEPTKGN